MIHEFFGIFQGFFKGFVWLSTKVKLIKKTNGKALGKDTLALKGELIGPKT
jgi:hypothetical protein